MTKQTIALCMCVFFISCTSREDDLKINTFNSGDPTMQKVVMVVANEGPEPIGVLRMCATRLNEYTEHQLPGNIKVLAGELFIIEQPNWFDERRLCTFTRFNFSQFVNVFDYATVIRPKVTGPGIYFMGSVISPEQIETVEDRANLYDDQIKDRFKADLLKVLSHYENLTPINFTVGDLQ